MSLVVPFLSEPTNIISSCLIQNQVKNFTLNANSGNDTFSIQNLRYAESTYTKPIVIVLPDTKEQLANTVLCSKQASLAIRVRYGGHKLFMIIDVMNLNNVLVDLESETALVEGGATLGDTYQAIAKSSHLHGFSAGSCPTVGSGGHISGGGFEDVFWEVRGSGGGVWGIIYTWKVQLVPTRYKKFRSQIKPHLEDDFYLSFFVGAGLAETRSTGISAIFKGFYLGSTAEAISTLNREFPKLDIAEDDCKEMSWIESVNRYLDDKGYFKAKSDYVKEPISMRGIKTALRILENYKISSDSIPFPHRVGNIFAIQYLVAWNSTYNSKNDVYISWIRNFYNSMTKYVEKGPRTSCVNVGNNDNNCKKTESNT
ncbi:hypothetical protein MKW98_003265 [Papaver atlanticum]|uniref:FAD linked oxidase N-terminal domain-containing protein n=1 Tax=Papaver atlanticum TaxID=357466 RepID=A0AAD4TAV1_9MAGN|nr:hypothetical protein MKW98_003265 [Papaver atlanticum]